VQGTRGKADIWGDIDGSGMFMRRIDLETIKSLSLKWKLLIPFLFFAFVGTTSLTYLGLTSQQRLIIEEEKKSLLHYHHRFLEEVEQKGTQAMSLATMIAENPQVQSLLAQRDRQALIDLLMPTYVQLKMYFNIEQFHFHLPGAISFLRLHYLERFGDDMALYRKTIMDAAQKGRPVAGLELGATGFGIRAVAPIFFNFQVVGTVEIGNSFDTAFLEDLHERWHIDLALYAIKDAGVLKPMARAGKSSEDFLIHEHVPAAAAESTVISVAPAGHTDRSLLFAPVRDYSGVPVAVLEINLDHSEIQGKLSSTRNLMILIGVTGIALSFLLTYLVILSFIKPISTLVTEAHDIAQEKREIHLDQGPKDEIGSLTEALNLMLDSLKEKRMAIEGHARTLEKRVGERTADLVTSEEKYRTLVENVPLMVYRVLEDGTTEFINSYLTESLGYSIEEAVSDKRFWMEKICGLSAEKEGEICVDSFHNGEEHRTERQVRDKKGRALTFMDHAIPAKDAEGRVKWVDGIMIDITELKGLQERALRTEEIRILGGISAHVAHEIRNPLIAAGGFARRLRDALPETDPRKKQADIIVKEVARIEGFLKVLFSSISPFDLVLADVDLNGLLSRKIAAMEPILKTKGVEVVLDLMPSLPVILADEERLNQAFENLIRHAVVSTPAREKLVVASSHSGDRAVVHLRHKVHRLSEDDLDKFFFPHIEETREWTVVDLPLSRIIIHRHGGKVDLSREGENTVDLKIELPEKPSGKARE
jgi:PAS domain S-box-containing protein